MFFSKGKMVAVAMVAAVIFGAFAAGVTAGRSADPDGPHTVAVSMGFLEYFFSEQWSGGLAEQELLAFVHRPPDCSVVGLEGSGGKYLIVTIDCP